MKTSLCGGRFEVFTATSIAVFLLLFVASSATAPNAYEKTQAAMRALAEEKQRELERLALPEIKWEDRSQQINTNRLFFPVSFELLTVASGDSSDVTEEQLWVVKYRNTSQGTYLFQEFYRGRAWMHNEDRQLILVDPDRLDMVWRPERFFLENSKPVTLKPGTGWLKKSLSERCRVAVEKDGGNLFAVLTTQKKCFAVTSENPGIRAPGGLNKSPVLQTQSTLLSNFVDIVRSVQKAPKTSMSMPMRQKLRR